MSPSKEVVRSSQRNRNTNNGAGEMGWLARWPRGVTRSGMARSGLSLSGASCPGAPHSRHAVIPAVSFVESLRDPYQVNTNANSATGQAGHDGQRGQRGTNEQSGVARERLMTAMETYMMRGGKSAEPGAFCPLPRFSLPPRESREVRRGQGPDEGWQDHEDQTSNWSRNPEGDGSVQMSKAGGRRGKGRGLRAGDVHSSNAVVQHHRNPAKVPAFYKVKEVNSNFFYSALGIIIAICIVFNIIAVITAVESDPNIQYRHAPSHVHIAFLAIILLLQSAKYAVYFLNLTVINRRAEIASFFLAIVVLVTLCVYGHWLIKRLPTEIHATHNLQLPCGAFGFEVAAAPNAKPQNSSQKSRATAAITKATTTKATTTKATTTKATTTKVTKKATTKATTTAKTTATKVEKAKLSNNAKDEQNAEKEVDNPVQIPMEVWYTCALIRYSFHAGIACIVFSSLLLLGLIANVIHACLGIQNGVDVLS